MIFYTVSSSKYLFLSRINLDTPRHYFVPWRYYLVLRCYFVHLKCYLVSLRCYNEIIISSNEMRNLGNEKVCQRNEIKTNFSMSPQVFCSQSLISPFHFWGHSSFPICQIIYYTALYLRPFIVMSVNEIEVCHMELNANMDSHMYKTRHKMCVTQSLQAINYARDDSYSTPSWLSYLSLRIVLTSLPN